jgi:Concanavalin A-like lectin/glucanases superfamily/PKD domain
MSRCLPIALVCVVGCGEENNWTPLAAAGADQVVALGETAQLDGSSSWDPDGDIAGWEWSVLVAPDSAAALLNAAETASPTLQLAVEGTYTLLLVVTDSNGVRSAPDVVNIVADPGNSPPVAVLAATGEAAVDATISFDAALSYDNESTSLEYTWTLEVAPPLAMATIVPGADPTTAVLLPDAIGTWVVGLTVSDGRDSSRRSDVVLTVVESINLAPIADCGGDQSWPTAGPIELDGTLSQDPEGGGLSYSWTLDARPSGSAAAVIAADQRIATLNTDVDGDYRVGLVVHDGSQASEPCQATVSIGQATANGTPVADAGLDQAIAAPGLQVWLDGSLSSDPDGDALGFVWELTGAPAESAMTSADIDTADPITPSFLPDAVGNYQLLLQVCDDGGLCDDDTVVVTVEPDTTTNTPPVCAAGDDQTVELGASVSLDGGASSDADGDTLYMTWWLGSTPTSSSASLTGAYSVTPSFTPDLAGTYTVRLRVSDGTDSCTDSLQVEVTEPASTNTAPLCDAGADQSVDLGASVSLDGTSSSDADGDTLSYTWWFGSIPSGSASELTARFSTSPSWTPDLPGTYKVNLRVSDGTDACTDAVEVTVTGTLDTAPVADAGADQETCLQSEFLLDGTGSSDVDGDTLSYSWALTFTPAGSFLEVADLTDAETATPSFVPDIEGTYVLTLTVSDGTSTSTDTVSVTWDSDDTVLVWHFDEGSGEDLLDSSPTGNDGALLGGEWTDGVFETGAAAFDGFMADARAPADSSLDIVDAGTIDLYMRTWSRSRDYEVIFTKGVYNYALYRLDDTLVFYGRTGTDAFLSLSATASSLGDGTWHHYAVVIGESDVTIYEDGAAIGSTPRTAELKPNTGLLYIGRAPFMRLGRALDADIDELIVRDIALSAADVRDRAAATTQVCPAD